MAKNAPSPVNNAPITDLYPSNRGALCWRDDGRAKGKLERIEIFDDRRMAMIQADLLRPGLSVKVHRRDLRVDGARIVAYVVIARAKEDR
jgi:hypothetical protein